MLSQQNRHDRVRGRPGGRETAPAHVEHRPDHLDSGVALKLAEPAEAEFLDAQRLRVYQDTFSGQKNWSHLLRGNVRRKCVGRSIQHGLSPRLIYGVAMVVWRFQCRVGRVT